MCDNSARYSQHIFFLLKYAEVVLAIFIPAAMLVVLTDI